MPNTENLEDALLDALRDLYSAEKQILKALPKMATKAVHAKLKEGFELHLQETQVHIERLDQISKILGIKLTGKVCKATAGIIEEGKEVLDEEGDNESVIDTMLVGAARRVEHYEIAAYCSAMALAQGLELSPIYTLLRETLAEETKTDSALRILAKKILIPLALVEDSESSDVERSAVAI